MTLEDIRNERLKKLALLKERGIPAYPAKSERTTTIKDLLSRFDRVVDFGIAQSASQEDNAKIHYPVDEALGKEKITVAGRVLSIREHGGSIFFNISDGTGTIQGYVKQDEIPADVFSLFVDVVDVGDFIDLSGTAMRTKRGEASVLASGWRMLAKSLRTLPEKWVGLTDPEERLRKRYLDILVNDGARDTIEKKAKFWQAMREFLVTRGFIEVETPALETTPGGADARPFKTHHNALDIDVYLRIAAGELWQKRLMVAGFPQVFEIGRIFRNEGMSAEHLQDYTQMEFYWGYADYEMGMKLVEELYKHVAEKTFGTLTFTIGGNTVDFSKPWERYDFRETLKKFTDIDIQETTLKDVEKKLKELNVVHSTEGWNLSRAIDQLWKYSRKQLVGPGFLVHVPVFLEPLAKRSPQNENVVERFQVILGGSEMGKGYSELNDPLDQRARFEEQQKLRDAGDEEAQRMDEDFVEALEYGMPPTCGFGVSERFFAFLSDKPVRETQIFPLMRPKKD